MKKITIISIAMILVLIFTLPTVASSAVYEVTELDLKMKIPTQYLVVTRDTPTNDPVFSQLGTTKTNIMDYFKKSSIYLNAMSTNLNEEIVVTMVTSSIRDLNLLSNTEIEIFASALFDEYDEYDFNISHHEIYQHKQAKFLKIAFNSTDKSVYGLQYYTVYNGKAMNFTMRSYSGPITSTQKNTIKTVVDSVEYSVAPATPTQKENMNSFIYTDEDARVSFTVPENWKQEDFTEERQYIDAKFVSTKESGCTIVYGSMDVWEGLSVSEKIGCTREDIDNSFFTMPQIAEIYGIDKDEISISTYNDIQYYQGVVTASSNIGESNFKVQMTQLLCVRNGWMYSFQFLGTKESPLFDDFVSMLNSVTYDTGTDNVDGGLAQTEKSTVGFDENIVQSMIVSFFPLIVLIVIVIIATKLLNRQPSKQSCKKTTANTPKAKNNVVTENDEYSEMRFCDECGENVKPSELYCHACGAKIKNNETLKQ